MNLELTEEQLALRDTVRRFLAEKAGLAGHVRPMLDDPRGTTDEVWRGLAELGALGLLVPVEYGGEDMSMFEAGIVAQELGAALHPGPWLSSAVAVPRALARCGAGGEQQSALANGSAIATLALPDSALRRGAAGHALSGELTTVPDAAAADTILVPVDGELLALPTSAPGIEIAETRGIDQSRKLFRVTLHGAPTEVVAAASADAIEAMTDDMIIAGAADALGAAQRVLDMTVEYAKVRHQFGSPIGSFQAVAHMCVDMHETVELARSGVLYALWAADNTDRTERHLAALRVKAFSGRLAGVGDLAIQVFGGIGFTWEHNAQLYLKRLLSFSRFLGNPGSYLDRVGAEMELSTT